MSDQLSSLEENRPETPPVREDLVNTAIKFLENPNVLKTSLGEQQRFLKRKGLTDEEIRQACEKSGAYKYHEQRNRTPPLPPSSLIPYPNSATVQISLFDKVKEVVHNVAIFSFVAYVVYKFYMKFIAPFFFGKKKKSVEESIDELDKSFKQSVNDLKNNLLSVKVEVDKISQGAESSTQRQLSDLKSEIATVKGLLLSRNQFPPVSKSSVVRPSIPAWQKTSISQDSDPDSDPERKAEELMEVGSGSGSSEHEHAAKNSDSSLDIISFSSKDSDFRRHKSKDVDDDDDDDKD
ncbi:peroxisomal membrane protein PEX14 [Tribolium castaneum]|uniref:Peroxisomal membrane protein PEX14 n=1 Tax=Tribolium castaneum TaxID=7070 RepID=D6X3A0_TRICA|nr:PREDICTED: peroxisomal membrane protein PEX14 [Tribolium castaneum]EFA10352.2 Peroxisomal membrane protein PEX14-like Protein [Tribolium castaneum]|eukprot:XP_973086.1 PREDICTED: peroxisomal membrane protein PEX14 [Tribolium castaneum]